jgi:predicted outer membrane lipoprotein
VLAWLVVVLAAIFVVLGATWYGFSPEASSGAGR